MHDTFYLLDENGKVAEDTLLRTHTSPIQVRYMQAHVAKYAHLQNDAGNPRYCTGPLSRRFHHPLADVPSG